MLATVTNEIQDLFLCLQLMTAGRQLAWVDLDTKSQYGDRFSTAQQAITWLHLSHGEETVRLSRKAP